MPDDFRRAAVERKRCLVMDVQVVDQRRRQYGLAGPKQPDKTDSFVGAAGVEAWQHEAHSFGESDLLVACETRLAPEDKNGDEHQPQKVNHQKNKGLTDPVRD